MMGVRCPIAFSAIMHIVEVELAFVAAETAILRAIHWRVVIHAVQNRLAIAHFDELRDCIAAAAINAGVAYTVAPGAVRILIREIRMEFRAGLALSPRRDISHFGQEFVPALMGEVFAARAAFHRLSLIHI